MRAFFSSGLVVLATALASPAYAQITTAEALAAKKITRLEPISPWNIDYGDNRCRLARVFGSDDERHLVSFVQSAPRAGCNLTIAGRYIRPYTTSRKSYLGMRDNAPMRQLERAGIGEVAGFGPAIILSSFSLARTEAEEAADEASKLRYAGVDPSKAETANSVTLALGKRALTFETGALKPAFEALNTCTRPMLTEWGLDPEEHESYRPPRLTHTQALAKAVGRKYPREALRRRQSGVFQMRLIVEADGTVSNCHLEQNTIADSLNSPACQIAMAVAEMEPAEDANGKPLRSFYATTITYSMNP